MASNLSTIRTSKTHQAYIYTLKPTATKACLPRTISRNSLYVLAKQPKSRHVGVWPWSDLNDSNSNLVEYNPDKDSAKNYIYPKGGLIEGLCKKIIYLWPKS